MKKHFDSDEGHKKLLADPKLMAQKILESQQSLLIRNMINTGHKKFPKKGVADE